MHLNIAHKIFGIAFVVLILMAAVAIFSVRLTSEISHELALLAEKQLPLSDTIGQINVKVLEQGILLQHLFALKEANEASLKRVYELDREIETEFSKAYELFVDVENSKFHEASVEKLEKTLQKVEYEYRNYEAQGVKLLALHEGGDIAAFLAELPDFINLQNAVDAEISTLRRFVEVVAEDAVNRADDSERSLLIFNASMTTISAILGLSFAAIVTFLLVKNVRNLVRATDEVGDGNLDIEVPVSTRDEVGKLAIAFNNMVADIRLKERIREMFGKYIDPRIVTSLIDNPELANIGGERKEMTIMFVDLQGYTALSEKLMPTDLVSMLNMFLAHMTEAVSNNKGVINDFQGDAVMAYWGPPFTSSGEHAALACKAALDAMDNFERYKKAILAELTDKIGSLDIAMRIGISTGEVISGNIGSAHSRKFSVVGDPVNLGARLEGVNKTYGTKAIISERTSELIEENTKIREVDMIKVKGKSHPTRIFELPSRDTSRISLYEGLMAYRQKDWGKAETIFRTYVKDIPDDPVPTVFLERIEFFKREPPPDDWDGVWEFFTK